MRKTIVKLLGVLLCALLLASLTGALAETGRLTVKLTPQQDLPDVSGVTFALYKVGDVDRSTGKGNVWATEGAYASVDFAHAETAKDVEDARDAIGAIVNSIGATPTYTASTGNTGEAEFTGVEVGLYYVQMTRGPQYLVVSPALVTMPMVTEDGVVYDFDMTPKFVVQVVTPTPTPTPTPIPEEETPTPEPTEEPTPTPAVTNVDGMKIWEDDGNAVGVRPANITVRLYGNGVLVSTTPTWGDRTGNTWSYSFNDLPAEDQFGNPINYIVNELPVEYYQTTVNGTTITNTLIDNPPEEYTNVAGQKIWDDFESEQRPVSITVQLRRNGTVIETRTVTAADGWRYDFGRLPLDNGYGTTYTYTVDETPVLGYYTLIDGYNITNVLLPGPPPMFATQTEPELEELIDLPEYGTPLYGELLGTGDETPIYPFIFAGIGLAAVALLLIFGKKRKENEAGKQ